MVTVHLAYPAYPASFNTGTTLKLWEYSTTCWQLRPFFLFQSSFEIIMFLYYRRKMKYNCRQVNCLFGFFIKESV